MNRKAQAGFLMMALALAGGCASASKAPVIDSKAEASTQADAIACRQMRRATDGLTFLAAAQAATKADDAALRQAGDEMIDAFAVLDSSNADAIGERLGQACKRLGL